jgi:ABC-type multidrug transport system permease subunit
MPGWLQPAAKISPVTVTVDTIRGLSLGGAVSTDFWKSIAWMSGLLAIFVPLAVYRYRHTS